MTPHLFVLALIATSISCGTVKKGADAGQSVDSSPATADAARTDAMTPDAAFVPDASMPDAGPPDAAVCGGAFIGGHCWYLATSGESCDSVCSTRGGATSATVTYAGAPSAGDSTNAVNCSTIIQVIADETLTNTSTFLITSGYSAVPGVGCIQDNQSIVGGHIRPAIHLIAATTTAAPSQSHLKRACACTQ